MAYDHTCILTGREACTACQSPDEPELTTVLRGIDPSELRQKIDDLTYMWSTSRDHADWICAFCKERPPTNDSCIAHKEDCFGLKILDTLKEK